jgi:uncharacterized protein YjbI with pentapeptide repeats
MLKIMKSPQQLEIEHTFVNANLKGSNFSNRNFTAASYSNNVVGITADIPYIFSHCDLTEANFSHSKNLSQVLFMDCIIEAANFKSTEVTAAQFINCKGEAKFSSSSINRQIKKGILNTRPHQGLFAFLFSVFSMLLDGHLLLQKDEREIVILNKVAK